MTGGLVIQLRKEVRALLPWWAGIVAVMAMCWILEPTSPDYDVYRVRLRSISAYAYALGSVCLGALSLGHEYMSGTLPQLLTHPVDRMRLALIKGSVLSGMLGALAVMSAAVFGTTTVWATFIDADVVVWLPLLCGVCLAPWITMVSGGTLPGTVFTVAIPFILVIAAAAVGVPAAAALPIGGVLAIAGALLSLRTFLRLEALSGSSPELEFGTIQRLRASTSTASTTRHPLVSLFMKELRLQQVVFVLAALFTALWTGLSLVDGPVGARYAATLLYASLVSIMCGALASAEERRFGTSASDRLVPVSHRAKWAIKTGTALSVAVVLAAGLPAALHAISPEALMTESFHPIAVLLFCVSALYVSSLSTSGIHATLATIPAMAAAGAVGVVIYWTVTLFATTPTRVLAAWIYPMLDITQPDWRWRLHPENAGVITAFLMVFAFAGSNQADDGRSRVFRQCLWLACLLIVVLLVGLTTEGVIREWSLDVLSRS